MADEITPQSKTTPFSKETISSVNSNTWHDMSSNALSEQLHILHQRLAAAKELNITQAIVCIEQGIKQITHIIDERDKGE